MTASAELYQELILYHSRSPRHYGTLETPSCQATGDNPLCGDSYTVQLELDADGVITDGAFAGTGCAISKASASLMLETVIGKDRARFEKLFEDFHKVVKGEGDSVNREPLGKLAAFESIWKYPSRVKCAILCWHAVRTALSGGDVTTTEVDGGDAP